MAEHESLKSEPEENKIRKRDSRASALEKTGAEETPAERASHEGFSALLRDPRLSHPANAVQKAELLSSLQRKYGNAYVQRLLRTRAVQAKLTVNPPDDVYEKEADRVAEMVSTNAPVVQREAEEEEEELQTKAASGPRGLVLRQEEEEELQMKPIAGPHGLVLRQEEEEELLQGKRVAGPDGLMRQEEEEELLQGKPVAGSVPEVADDIEQRINSARGSGQGLPDSVRTSFEPFFGRDFSDVRAHTDSEANNLSQQLGARAFTTGKDIFFGAGEYQPESEDGRKLIGHEITHVVQQSGALAPIPDEAVPAAIKIEGKRGTDILAGPKVNEAVPHAFSNLGKTGSFTVHWGGGRGGLGGQFTGDITTLGPVIEGSEPAAAGQKAKAWVRPGTGTARVTRSYTGVIVGSNNSYYITARAAARIDTHEELHVNKSKEHHDAIIVPLEERLARHRGEAVALRQGSTGAEAKAALENLINWDTALNNFRTADTRDNRPMGTVDTTDMATADFYADYGPRTVDGTNYAHYVDQPPGPRAE